VRADVTPQSAAVRWCIQRIALALALQADTVAVTVLLTVLDLASIAVEALVAEADTIAANPVFRAPLRTGRKRAIMAREAIDTLARVITHALTITRTCIGTPANRAVISRKAWPAAANSVIAPSVAEAVTRAACQVAPVTGKAREAVACAVVAITILGAVRVASNQRAIEAREAVVANASVVDALTIASAVPSAAWGRTVVTRVTGVASANTVRAVTVTRTVVRASLEPTRGTRETGVALASTFIPRAHAVSVCAAARAVRA